MEKNYSWYKDELKGEYWEAFDKVELYGQSKITLDSELFEDMMMNLIDMFITAQKNEKPVEKIIGTDIEAFCKDYFDSYKSKATFLLKLPKKIVALVWFMFVFELIELFAYALPEADVAVSIFKIKTDIGPYLIGFLSGTAAAFIAIMLIKPFIFKSKWLTSTKAAVITLLMIFAIVVPVIIFTDNVEAEVPIIEVLIISALYLIVYYVVKAATNFKKYGSVKAPSDKEKIAFKSELKKSVLKEMPKELKKRYEKINKKRMKKNKPLMTPDEYMKKLKKEDAQSDIALKIVYVLIGVGCIIFAITSTESFIDGVIYLAVMAAMEIPLYRFFNNRWRVELLNKCDELGIDIIEYANRLENECKDDIAEDESIAKIEENSSDD